MADSPPPAGQAESTERALPPLRIYHFFWWSIAVAAVMALLRSFNSGGEAGQEAYLVYQFVVMVPLSVAAMTLLLGVYWRKQGFPFFGEPGHWLLLTLTLGLAGNLSAASVSSVWSNYPRDSKWMLLGLFVPFMYGLSSAAVYFYLAFRSNVDFAWRRFFSVALGVLIARFCTVALGFFFLQFFSTSISENDQLALINATTLLLILIAVAYCGVAIRSDLVNSRRRHWSHWCGALIWVGSIAVSAVYTAVNIGQWIAA